MSDVQRSSLIQDLREEAGQTLAEYALILSLIAILAIISLMFVGGQINGILSTIGAAL
jgi:Flp pilus assembly pilin Flp